MIHADGLTAVAMAMMVMAQMVYIFKSSTHGNQTRKPTYDTCAWSPNKIKWQS